MELVYLWVENYKNIYRQGFNFSPRFECEFDGESLTICDKKEKDNNYKNKDYIENFFGKNINITAIVGENGSGKSNLLKNIKKISELKLYYKDYIAILKKEKQLFYLSSEEIKLNKPCIKLTNINLDKELKQREIQRVFIKNDEINEQTFNEEYFNLLIQNQKIDYQFLSKNFFDSCRIKINKRKRENFLSLNNVSENSDLFSSYETELLIRKKENIFYCFEFILNEIIFTFRKDKESIIERINSINGTNQEKIIKAKEILKESKSKVDKDNPNFFQDKNYQKLFELFFEFNISEFEKIYENLTKAYTTKDIKKLDKSIKKNELLSYLKEENVFIYDFFDSSKNVYFQDLSDGEKRFLGFFTHLTSKIKHETDYNNFILLDEPDIFLHPNWQKKFIKNLIDFFKINYPNKILHIFITSHSPFILSDIPKENVIFLDKFDDRTEKKYPTLDIKDLKNGNCINVSKNIKLKTFGANIHTLLSNGFFMSDGLMGEFAKNKIMEILEYLNDSKNEVQLKTINEKQINPIIESIGEDFLRNKLLNLYHNKLTQEEKEKEKQILKNKIDELQRQYDELNK
jgi:predicted ATP-binding protein involved in virulence